MNEQSKKNKQQYDLKYQKQKQKRVALNWLKDDFDNVIEPAIKQTGLPVSTFIKKAVVEKLCREGYLNIDECEESADE